MTQCSPSGEYFSSQLYKYRVPYCILYCVTVRTLLVLRDCLILCSNRPTSYSTSTGTKVQEVLEDANGHFATRSKRDMYYLYYTCTRRYNKYSTSSTTGRENQARVAKRQNTTSYSTVHLSVNKLFFYDGKYRTQGTYCTWTSESGTYVPVTCCNVQYCTIMYSRTLSSVLLQQVQVVQVQYCTSKFFILLSIQVL